MNFLDKTIKNDLKSIISNSFGVYETMSKMDKKIQCLILYIIDDYVLI